MSAYLGIDIGTSATKCIAIDENGNILAQASKSYPCYHPKPLWSEQDPEDWWQATISTTCEVVKTARLKKTDVKAIGLSGQMHGAVFLDKKNRVIRKAILWNDQRTEAECGEIVKAAGGRKALVKMVANPALTGFTLPKILWLRNREPKHFENTRKVLLPKDEIRRRLTGEFATDLSDASGTLLLDVAKRQWSKPLMSKLSLDPTLFADCYESEDITGTLTKEAADLLGLSQDCVVVGGAGDCAAGAIGNGIVKEGLLAATIGSSGVMFVHSDKVEVDPEGRLHTFCHAVRGKWHMMGVNLAGGACLQWFAENICTNGLKQHQGQSPRQAEKDIYQVLSAEAEKIPAGADGLIFLPYLAGERTPHADPNARGSFIGLTLSHKRGHMVRAILEGVTYALRESLEIFGELAIPVKEIRTTGGGSKNPLWRQIQADVFGKPVTTLQAEEGAAYGAALLAASGAGAFKNVVEACRATIKVAGSTKVNKEAAAGYTKSFAIYQDLYQSLKSDFKSIAALSDN